MTFRSLVSLCVGLAVGAAVLTAPPAAAAPPEGAYWHSRSVITSTHPWLFGSKRNPYALLERSVSESWKTPEGRTWAGYRKLGARPKSAADRKAWRRDGSPTKWNTSIDGKTVKLSARPSRGSVNLVPKENKFLLADQWLRYDEVQRLPADPVSLKDWFRRAAQAGEVPEAALDQWIAGSLESVLHTVPVSKQVRAAAYRALLTTPGVRTDGTARDTLGRPGAVVRIEHGSVKIRLIVDTRRMVLLSRDQAVTEGDGKPSVRKSLNETLVEVGWTDSRPAIPAIPTSE